MSSLSAEALSEHLKNLSGWRLGDGEIFKWFKFKDFPASVAFIESLVEVAERLQHHPDIECHYNRVRLGLHTMSESAITEKDVVLAAEIEHLVQP